MSRLKPAILLTTNLAIAVFTACQPAPAQLATVASTSTPIPVTPTLTYTPTPAAIASPETSEIPALFEGLYKAEVGVNGAAFSNVNQGFTIPAPDQFPDVLLEEWFTKDGAFMGSSPTQDYFRNLFKLEADKDGVIKGSYNGEIITQPDATNPYLYRDSKGNVFISATPSGYAVLVEGKDGLQFGVVDGSYKLVASPLTKKELTQAFRSSRDWAADLGYKEDPNNKVVDVNYEQMENSKLTGWMVITLEDNSRLMRPFISPDAKKTLLPYHYLTGNYHTEFDVTQNSWVVKNLKRDGAIAARWDEDKGVWEYQDQAIDFKFALLSDGWYPTVFEQEEIRQLKQPIVVSEDMLIYDKDGVVPDGVRVIVPRSQRLITGRETMKEAQIIGSFVGMINAGVSDFGDKMYAAMVQVRPEKQMDRIYLLHHIVVPDANWGKGASYIFANGDISTVEGMGLTEQERYNALKSLPVGQKIVLAYWYDYSSNSWFSQYNSQMQLAITALTSGGLPSNPSQAIGQSRFVWLPEESIIANR